MFKALLVSAAVIVLTGCATGDLKTSVSTLVGTPAQKVIDRLGPPTSQTQDDGDTTYVWMSNTASSYTTATPLSDQQTSNLGVKDPDESLGNVSATTSTTTNRRCFIRVVAGADGRIKDSAWGGNASDCAGYASRLG